MKDLIYQVSLHIDQNYHVVGVDNLNDYYNVKLKKDRLDILKSYNDFKFIKFTYSKIDSVFAFKTVKPSPVVSDEITSILLFSLPINDIGE